VLEVEIEEVKTKQTPRAVPPASASWWQQYWLVRLRTELCRL